MKLNQNSTDNHLSHIVQQFGNATLVRHADGKHELIGGSTGDLAAAHEWVSLFAHEIVFSRPGQRNTSTIPCRLGNKSHASPLRRF